MVQLCTSSGMDCQDPIPFILIEEVNLFDGEVFDLSLAYMHGFRMESVSIDGKRGKFLSVRQPGVFFEVGTDPATKELMPNLDNVSVISRSGTCIATK